MTALTTKQTEMLAILRDAGIYGVCLEGRWKFVRADTGRTVNAGTVKALQRAGKLSITYYRGGKAGVDLTEAA